MGYTPRPESDAVNLETSSGSSSSTSGRRHGRTPVKSSAYSPLLSYWGPFFCRRSATPFFKSRNEAASSGRAKFRSPLLRLVRVHPQSINETTVSLEFSFRFVIKHRGPQGAFLERFEQTAADARAAGGKAYRKFCSDLPMYASDERNLIAALHHLTLYGGTSPGPDGKTMVELDRIAGWNLAREIRDRLRGGGYKRGPLRRCPIHKSGR